MDFDWRRALTYLREDLDYKRKLALVCFTGSVPFINIAVMGYGVEIYRALVDGKKDEDVQPEWTNSGDFLLKGILAAFIVLGYAILAVGCSVLFGMIFCGSACHSAMLGGEAHVPWIMKLFVAAAVYGVCVLFWAGFSLFCESVELSRAFRLMEVFLRAKDLGKGLLVSTAVWYVFTSLVVAVVNMFFGVSLTGLFILLFFTTFPSLFMVHTVAQLAFNRVKPVLSDVVNVGYMKYSLQQRAAEAAQEDEYGHVKEAGRKASHYADHHPTSVLTWSTDSDSPVNE